ncbi:amidohydrolase family protein [Shimia sagamensis]|uniref:Predicted metal-dependent hydrolase, TIM-barrel fold n=1 Tax=Shimia sagamensis TaxID=1566352 RepID=A0ABY1NRG2_9RHOB|nr:amidohydrolase family protein [Shimia sagamensis]SMP16099.1 Predicted metal-dependent hydrolase, TIM-barrel fold [Shimia sagamensis]
MRIDAHHHLWDLDAVHYPWLMTKGAPRFFGDPAAIQRDYVIEEFRKNASAAGIAASVHVQVGAADGLAEAKWVQSVADATPDWPMKQVVFCDLTAPDLEAQLDVFQKLPSVCGVRQIIGRAPGEDAVSGTNDLLDNPAFLAGLKLAGARGLSFDLQLIPELMAKTAAVLEQAPEVPVALCHAGSPHDRSTSGLATWAEDLQALSALPQVMCKLSGLGMFDHTWSVERIRPIVETCLAQFGPGRCMFGSNFPVDSLYSDYGTLFDAFTRIVPADMSNAVFGATANLFYEVLD